MSLNTPHAGRSQAVTYKSLGLNVLLSLLPENACLDVLDLGPALGANVDFWRRYSCRLHIRDFYRDYSGRAGETATEGQFEGLLSALLFFTPGTSFDAILTWDLFNYMEQETLAATIGRLKNWCKPGTMIFSLVSSQPQMPVRPSAFRIIGPEQITYETTVSETRPCPRHQPRDLARLLAGFDTSHSFLLRNGIQEYIFTYR